VGWTGIVLPDNVKLAVSNSAVQPVLNQNQWLKPGLRSRYRTPDLVYRSLPAFLQGSPWYVRNTYSRRILMRDVFSTIKSLQNQYINTLHVS
jgi:hypothetical protein